METLQNTIENAFDHREAFSPKKTPDAIRTAINETIHLLNSGKIRVAEKINHEWITHQWIKKAVLLFFKIREPDMFNISISEIFSPLM